MMAAVLGISAGAAMGALLRWVLGGLLNPLWPAIPLGTVAANLIGGLLIGGAAEFFASHGTLPVVWRLFIITGFLGGLTTFSTFSLELSSLLERHEWLLAGGHVAIHLGGSLFLTFVGIALVQVLLRTG